WSFGFSWKQTIKPLINLEGLLLEIFGNVHDRFEVRRGLNHRRRFRLVGFLQIEFVERLKWRWLRKELEGARSYSIARLLKFQRARFLFLLAPSTTFQLCVRRLPIEIDSGAQAQRLPRRVPALVREINLPIRVARRSAPVKPRKIQNFVLALYFWP